MFSQDSFFFFFRTIIPRISTGVKVMYLTEVIINWHKEILHLFSATFSSLLQLFLCSLSFSAILSLLGLRSFYYGILNTSFTRILAPVEKQAGRVMAGFAFLLYQGINYGPHRVHIADGIKSFFFLYFLVKGEKIIFFFLIGLS